MDIVGFNSKILARSCPYDCPNCIEQFSADKLMLKETQYVNWKYIFFLESPIQSCRLFCQIGSIFDNIVLSNLPKKINLFNFFDPKKS